MFRYQQDLPWYKGNTHIHSTRSDGGLDISEIAERYSKAGYNFIFLTDHMVASREWANGSRHSLPVFDGVEIHGDDSRGSFYHTVCLGTVDDLKKEMSYEEAFALCSAQNCLMILAHPAWTGNSPADTRSHEFHGVEAHNNICRYLNGKGNGLYHWDHMLENDPGIVGFACDDAHFINDYEGVWNGGWIMVQARDCTQESILESLRAGAFYSSQGPEIHSLRCDGKRLSADTTRIARASIVGERSKGARAKLGSNGETTSLSIELPENYRFIRLEIEDAEGKRAWTNPLFAGEDPPC